MSEARHFARPVEFRLLNKLCIHLGWSPEFCIRRETLTNEMSQYLCFTQSAKGHPGQTVKCRWLPAILILASLSCTSFAQNLIGNGDFETGAFPPWTNSGNVSITNTAIQGSKSCIFGFVVGGGDTGKIEQTIPTIAGTVYYLTLDLVNGGGNPLVTLSASPAGGGPADGSREIQLGISSTDIHYSLVFTATSTSTKIAIESEAGSLIDSVRLLELPPHPRAGRYAGVAKTILTSEESGLVNKTSSKVVARVMPTGQIVLLQGTTVVGAGIILPDDTLEIRIDGRDQSGEVTFRGTKLTFTLTKNLNALDEGLNPVDSHVQTVFTLTRIGR